MECYNPFSLEGKTILITGAAGGIGGATAIECAKLGASLILTDINEEGLADILGKLENPDLHRYVVANLTNDDEINNLVDGIEKLDGLVSNAGVTKPAPVKFVNRADLDRIMSVNAFAPIFLTQRLLKKKKFSKNSSIVFTVSIGGVYTTAFGNAMYGTSKGALQVFMKNVALESAANGIRCNSVNPGMINTGLLKPGTYSEEDRQKDMQTYPMKRYGDPREVALGIVYLLSDASSFVTGHSLIIDGGKTLY